MNNALTTRNERWYTSKEMCEMCDVDERTLKRFNEYLTGDKDVTSQLIKKGGYHNSQYFYNEEALKQFQLWLQKSQASQGRGSEMAKYEVNAMVDENNEFKYSKEDICKMFNVHPNTFGKFRLTTECEAKSIGRSHKEYFTEEALKQFQLWLMRNQANQGNASSTIKQATTQSMELGALTIAANKSVKATQELCELLMAKAYETERANQLEEQNTQLALDVKEAKEETAHITHVASAYQHNFPWKPSILGKQFGISGKAVNDIFVANGFIYKDPRTGVWIVTESGKPYAWYGWNDKSVEYPQLYYSDLAYDFLRGN